ncbi:LysR family transcriptional regulator [Cryptosporangium sp. NPDC048952]|uniref:LysR family transcriptional regulator n=1 Tax=Cryptosporangium sp. NPDC048952 TaxID=3363961 RepID=UPI0037217C05
MPGEVMIRQLEYLAALDREQHFGRAAATCHATQPALSAALRKLERQLGVTIVRRGRRFDGFTPEGLRVVGWAHRILAERDALRIDLDRMRHGLTATVRLGAIPTAVPATPLISEAMMAKHPLARMRIEVLPAPEIVRRLHAYELDAGLTYLPEAPIDESQALRLYRERYALLTPADGPLHDRETVEWADAATLPLCALVSSMQNRRIIDEAMAMAGVTHVPVIEAETVDALYAHLATGAWSGVIAHTWLRAYGVPAGMRTIPLASPAPSPVVGLVTGDHGPSSMVASAVLDAVRAADLVQALA